MLCHAAVLISFLLASSALGIPALEKRTCSYFYQPTLNTISQHLPESSSPQTTTPFTVWTDIGKKDLVASFRYIPSGATGCQLEFDYQPGNNPVVSSDVGDPTVLNVWRLSDGGNFPYSPTWDNSAPRQGPLLGSWQFPSGNDLNTAKVIFIASFTCDAVLTFRFSIADDNARGGMQVGENATSGLRITYNC